MIGAIQLDLFIDDKELSKMLSQYRAIGGEQWQAIADWIIANLRDKYLLSAYMRPIGSQEEWQRYFFEREAKPFQVESLEMTNSRLCGYAKQIGLEIRDKMNYYVIPANRGISNSILLNCFLPDKEQLIKFLNF